MAERTGTGWLFSLVGGALIATLGLALVGTYFPQLRAVQAATDEQAVNVGMVLAAAGLLVLFGSVAFYAMPDQRRNWAALVIALSVLAWIASSAFYHDDLTGLFLTVSIGPILGILGGGLGLFWKAPE